MRCKNMLITTKKQIFRQLSTFALPADVFLLSLHSVFYHTAVFNTGKQVEITVFRKND